MNECRYQESDYPSSAVCRFASWCVATVSTWRCSRRAEMRWRRQLILVLMVPSWTRQRLKQLAARDNASYSRWCRRRRPAPVLGRTSRCTRDTWSSPCETRVPSLASPARSPTLSACISNTASSSTACIVDNLNRQPLQFTELLSLMGEEVRSMDEKTSCYVQTWQYRYASIKIDSMSTVFGLTRGVRHFLHSQTSLPNPHGK